MARPKRYVSCLACKKKRLHKAKGLCDRCYKRQWVQANPGRVYVPKEPQTCIACGVSVPRCFEFRCPRCYYQFKKRDPEWLERKRKARREYQRRRRQDPDYVKAHAEYMPEYRSL